MNIIGIYPEENRKLCTKFSGSGITGRLEKGITIFDIPNPSNILELPLSTEYFIEAFEMGGGKTNVGYGIIVCDQFDGKELKPQKVYTDGHLCNSKHAKFVVENCITISSTKRGNIVIVQNEITIEYGTIFLKSECLWTGNIKDLPNTYNYLEKACEAAHEKANCFHCREPHYILK